MYKPIPKPYHFIHHNKLIHIFFLGLTLFVITTSDNLEPLDKNN